MGLTDSLNTDPLHGAMTTLPVFVYYQYTQPGTPADGYLARAWAGALTLVLLVMALNAIGRLVAFRFAPKTRS
jgi:phosphate transport system permease protein